MKHDTLTRQTAALSALIRWHLSEIVEDLDERELPDDVSFSELGADSVDVAQALAAIARRLRIRRPGAPLARARTIGELAQRLADHVARGWPRRSPLALLPALWA